MVRIVRIRTQISHDIQVHVLIFSMQKVTAQFNAELQSHLIDWIWALSSYSQTFGSLLQLSMSVKQNAPVLKKMTPMKKSYKLSHSLLAI